MYTRRELDTRLALSRGRLWLVLSRASYGEVSLGLRPLDRVRHELDRRRRSPAARLSGRHPQEILPLTEAINAMAAAREADLGRARRDRKSGLEGRSVSVRGVRGCRTLS